MCGPSYRDGCTVAKYLHHFMDVQLLRVSFSSTVYVFILVLLRGKPQSCASISCISSFLQGPFLY